VKPLKVIEILKVVSSFLERFIKYDGNSEENISEFQTLCNTFKGFESVGLLELNSRKL
jgi:hypothetical protein